MRFYRSNEVIDAICDMIKRFDDLKWLDFSGMNLSDYQTVKLLSALRQSKIIKTIEYLPMMDKRH